MLNMFKYFKSRYPASFKTISAITSYGMGIGATAFLTHYWIKNESPDVQQVYWDNFLDPDECRYALTNKTQSTRKP